MVYSTKGFCFAKRKKIVFCFTLNINNISFSKTFCNSDRTTIQREYYTKHSLDSFGLSQRENKCLPVDAVGCCQNVVRLDNGSAADELAVSCYGRLTTRLLQLKQGCDETHGIR